MGSRIIGCRVQLHTRQAQRPQTGLAIDLHVLPCQVLQLLIDGIAGVQSLIYDCVSSLHERSQFSSTGCVFTAQFAQHPDEALAAFQPSSLPQGS